MKAVRIYQHGGVDQLRFEETADPKLTSGTDAIVKLTAASLNDHDLQVRGGLGRAKTNFPQILGADGAGIVVEVGSQVRNVKPGEFVCLYPPRGCGDCPFCATDREPLCAHFRALGDGEQGTYAEYVTLPARNCFRVPAQFSHEEAAALPSDYLSVWKMLISDAQLKAGEFVLIRTTGGGLGAAAIQLACRSGARTLAAAASDAILQRAIELGAEHGIRDQPGELAGTVRQLTDKRGVDVVVDCRGDTWSESLACLARGGRLVTCGAAIDPHPQTDLRRIFWNHLRILGSTLGSREDFRQVLNFVESCGTTPVIDRIFDLRDAAAAQQRLEEGAAFGKIVLRMDDCAAQTSAPTAPMTDDG